MRSRIPLTRLSRDERGFSLVFVLIVSGMLLALATGLASVLYLDTAVQNASARAERNRHAAEAGMNRGIADFRNIFDEFREPNGSDFDPHTVSFAGQSVRYQISLAPAPAPATNPMQVTIGPGERFAGLNSIRYRYNVFSDALGSGSLSEARVGARFDVHNIPIFQFVAFFQGDLEILPGPDMNLHGRVHTNSELYLNANSTLTISDFPPQFTNVQVSAGGSIHRGRKNVSNDCRGTVTIDRLADADNDGSLDPLVLPCSDGVNTRTVGTPEQANWLGSLISGVSQIQVPSVDVFARAPEAKYWKEADLRIVLDLQTDNGDTFPAAPNDVKLIEVQQVNGTRDVPATVRLRQFMTANRGKIFYNDVPNCTPANGENCSGDRTKYTPNFGADARVYRRADDARTAADTALWNADFDYRRGGFWSNREGTWLHLLNVDMQALLQWNMAQAPGNQLFDPDDATGGGLVIFLSVKGALSNGQNNYGVRVFDSADIPFNTTGSADPTGLTVVSDQAIFVEGDYNSVNVDPAAFMGDSINVLSEGWEKPTSINLAGPPATTVDINYNDQKSRFSLQGAGGQRNRRAAATTVNAAFLGGADVTIPGVSYSGGFENFPRFHEKWANDAGTQLPFNYRGSFVSLAIPQHVDGLWCGTSGQTNASATGPIVVTGCNIYDPPNRNWDYDRGFDQVKNLPPLTPRFIFSEQQSFTQEFR